MGPSGTVQTQVHSNTLKFSNTLKGPAAWGGNGEGCQPHKLLILSGASADICHGFDCFCNAVSLQLFPAGRWVWHAVAPIPLYCTELLSSTTAQQPSSQHQHFSEPANPRVLTGQATLFFQQQVISWQFTSQNWLAVRGGGNSWRCTKSASFRGTVPLVDSNL